MSVGATCTITPSKNINIRNGVSTFDLVKMQAHILQIDTLDSPYKILAGDVNTSGNLSTFDLVVLRKVILFNQDTFVNTDSWRFLPEDFEFTDSINPFLDDFPEELTCTDIQNGGSSNFIGFKVGDVTGNANPANWTDEPERRVERMLKFSIKDDLLKKGKNYRIPVYVESFNDITGLHLDFS